MSSKTSLRMWPEITGVPRSLKALAEPGVDALLAGAGHRADRDELHARAVHRLDAVEQRLGPVELVEVGDPDHHGVARVGDLRPGQGHGDRAVVAAAEVGAQQHLERVVHPRRQVERPGVVGDQVHVHLGQPGEDRGEDGAVDHRVDHRPRLVDDHDQPCRAWCAWRCAGSTAGRRRAARPRGSSWSGSSRWCGSRSRLRNTRLGGTDRSMVPTLACCTWRAQHLGDLVDEPADQRLGVGQGDAGQVGLVAQQLLDQRHARGQLRWPEPGRPAPRAGASG